MKLYNKHVLIVTYFLFTYLSKADTEISFLKIIKVLLYCMQNYKQRHIQQQQTKQFILNISCI